jgi:beta-lactamase class A
MRIRTLFFTGLLVLLTCCQVIAQSPAALKQKIERLVATKQATVGVCIAGIEDDDFVGINADQHFPMQSVFKFPISLTVLHEADEGKFSLNQLIWIKKSDLSRATWSPLARKYPGGNVKLPLADILQFTVAKSDNNGCDILLRLIGGTRVVNNYMHQLGIKDISVVATEAEMHKDWDIQFSNWITPEAATKLLKLFYNKKILSPATHDFLWKVMVSTTTGADRIKGQLPAGTAVAHKTGSSGTNSEGITAAANDIGIVTLPDGRHFAISVFVTQSKENDKENSAIIAGIAKLAWDYYVNKKR